MDKRFCFFYLILLIISIKGISQNFIPLWPEGKLPNSKGMITVDSIANERIFKVSYPGIMAFFPPAAESKSCAVLICPGGGYERIAYVTSGIQLAKWFNTIGITAFVLKYRLPNSPDLKDRTIGPLQDAQRAMQLIRANAVLWNIDPNKIGVHGTSAGGHLAASLSTYTESFSDIRDSLSKISFRPDFMLLLSPVISLGEYAHAGSCKNLLGEKPSPELIKKHSPDLHVTKNNPPAFIVHAFNDKSVRIQNSLMMYEALVKHDIPSSLHTFPQGAHGIVLHHNPGSVELWTDLCAAWLTEMGFTQVIKK